MTVLDKVRDGEYKTKLVYPTKPVMPDVLKKRALELTTEEMVNIKQVIADWETAQLQYPVLRQNYFDDQNRLEEQFRIDLAEENGLVGHPKEPKLFAIAWEYGHSSGLHEVAYHYEEFAALVR